MSATEICPICGRAPEAAGSASLEKLAQYKRAANVSALRTIHADEPGPVRKVAATIFIESDASCVDIARALHEIFTDAGITGYQLGVAPVESKL